MNLLSANKSNILVNVVIVMHFVFFCATSSFAKMTDTAPHLTSVKPSPILIVGSEQNFPPFATGLTDQEADGFTVELWRAVAEEMNIHYKIRVLPFHEILNEFKNNNIDVLINLAQSNERRSFVDFTVPHVVVNGAVFVRKDEDFIIKTENDLNGKSVIVLKADLAHDYALSKGWEGHLILVDTVERGMKLLNAGSYDAMLISKLTGLQVMQKEQLKNIKVLNVKVGYSQKFSFAVQKGNSKLLSQLNEGLSITKSNRKYDEVYEKWFGIYESKERNFYEIFIYFMPLVVLLVGLIGYFYYTRNTERKKNLHEMQIAAKAFETHEAIMVMDDKATVMRINHAFTKITGYPPQGVIGNQMNLFFASEQNNADLNMWDVVVANGFWEGDLECRNNEGSHFPSHLTLSAVKNNNGLITNIVGIFNDNTTNINLEKQRQLNEAKYRATLVREVHHRIKNNLQGVVLLLSNMAYQHPLIKEVIEGAISKVTSLAVVHGIQGNNYNSEISLIELVNSIVENNQSLFSVKINLQLPIELDRIHVIQNESVPVALILNELITNAVKHSGDNATIFIQLHYNRAKEQYVICIKNSGALSRDAINTNSESGIGIDLIKSLMPKVGMNISWKEKGDSVVSTLELYSPIIKHI